MYYLLLYFFPFQTLFILSLVHPPQPKYGTYDFPPWSITLGWFIMSSSLLCIPGYAIYLFFITPGSPLEVHLS